MRCFAPLLALTTLALAPPAAAEGVEADCVAGICQVRLTPPELLQRAETLVRARRFDEADVLIQALGQAPEMRLQSRFLEGYSASEKGNFAHAADIFKAILTDDPKQTRVRLELARAMLGLGQSAGADRQFRLAEQDGELPPDVARAVRGAREVIRSRRAWRLDVDLGIAPDTNINNATANDVVTVYFGDSTLPVELDDDARQRSGVGGTASISAGVRIPLSPSVALLTDVDMNGTNYVGSNFDDYVVQFAAGPELRMTGNASISAQAVGAQRWFAGRVASRQFGIKSGAQIAIGSRRRIGVQLDLRSTDAQFDSNYSGWQGGIYATAEQSVGPALVVSAGGFVRRDWLNAATYSNTEVGVNVGFGGELPLGISFGLGGSVSRAGYDAPMAIFSPEPRRDWRYSTRLTVGNRKVRVFGFSPQANLSYSRTDSSIGYFANDRIRLRLALARYF